jgi:hypothetical protein
MALECALAGRGGVVLQANMGITASATTRFSTDYSELRLALTGCAHWDYSANEQDMRVTLKDITAATLLLDLMHLDEENCYRQTEYFNIAVDPTHEYELALSGWADLFDAKEVDMGLNVRISELGAPVPEPSTYVADALLLILPFGVHGIRHFRNRKS